MEKFIFLLFFLGGQAFADVYMHNPRGSNNRNEENGRPRKNANRLFDSQNNERGGYNSGTLSKGIEPMKYYVGSVLPIEWTNQHGCGPEDKTGKGLLPNTHCELIIQYMCSPDLRDGTITDTIKKEKRNDPSYGMHETYEYYEDCETRKRNKGLFTADQDLKGDTAKYTRQNPGGTRRGFECPEERDYYPYWGPSPWKDIAVLTNDISRCQMYKKNSRDVVCREAPPSRDNHNGNGPGGFPNYYNWTIPNDGQNKKCALRLRYNISTSEMDWNTDSKFNAVDENNNNNNNNNDNLNKPTKIDIGSKMGLKPIVSLFSGYMLKNNPKVHPFESVPLLEFQLAVNTAQYGRTFQDRSHAFEIIQRPSNIPASAQIQNLNVRGKRGNIVQVYPAVEYDFVPNRLELNKNDYVHIQWTGSDKNPGNNDGEGRKGSDRSNMVLLKPQQFPEGTPGKAVPVALKMGQWGGNIPDCLCNSSLLGFSEPQRDNLALTNSLKGKAGPKLDETKVYFNLGPVKVTANEGTTYHYMSTRNNNFSNRSQKGRIVVKSQSRKKKDEEENINE